MKQKHNLPSAKEFFEIGRSSGQDSLDISEDPEALMALANVAWNGLVDDPCIEKLDRWIEIIADISKRVTGGSIRDWLTEQWAKAAVMAERMVRDWEIEIQAEDALEQMAEARKKLSASDFDRIAISIEPTIAHFSPTEEAEVL